MSLAFDATFYQTARPDVFDAFVQTQGSTGLTWAEFAAQHYSTFGWLEGSDPNANFDTSYYLSTYVDVAAAGVNPFDHFQQFGASEGRFPTQEVATAGFVEADYLAANTDVQDAVTAGTFASGYQHWILFGQFESRPGAPTIEGGSSGTTSIFTTSIDALTGTTGNDTFIGDNTGTTNTVSAADSVDGGAGTDTLQLFGTGAILPQISNIENLYFNNPGANGLDVSGLTSVTAVEIDNMEVTGANTENVTLAQGQALTLDSVVDNVGGANTFGVNGAATLTSLALTVDGAGNAATGGNDLNIDFGGADNLATLSVTATNNASRVTVTDGDNAITTVNVAGTVALNLGTLTTNVTTVDASGMSAGGLTVDLGVSAGAATVTGSAGNDDVTADAAVAYTVSLGAGDDRVTTGGNFTTADAFDGGEGTDTFETTTALTDALVGDLANFEILDIGGSDNITHDLGNFTTLTILEVAGAATGGTGDVIITDLVETATVRINNALGDGLVINQANSTVGSPNDTMTVDFSASTAVTTGQELEIDAIETLTFNSTSSGTNITHTLSDLQADAVSTLNLNATTAGFTITNISDANSLVLIDASGSTGTVTISSNDTFTSAYQYNTGAGADVLSLEGATTQAGTIYSLGTGFDSLQLDSANGNATVVRTSAEASANAFALQTDAGAANTSGFVSGQDDIDYNGTLSNNGTTTVVGQAGATLEAAFGAAAAATLYVINAGAGDAATEAALTTFAGTMNAANADAVEAAAAAYIGATAGLDAALTADESVLIALDVETNDAGGDNNGGTAIFRFTNTDATGNTVSASELELVGVATDIALATGDFI